MIIVCGTKSYLIKMDNVPDATCPDCDTKGGMLMNRYVKYVHIFHIPMFPYNSVGISQCETCDTYLRYKDMPQTTRLDYETFKIHVPIPKWTFIGSIILTAFILYILT